MGQWGIFLLSLVLIPFVYIGLYVFGFSRLYKWILASPWFNNKVGSIENISDQDIAYAKQTALVVSAATWKLFFKKSCLKRSLLLIMFLRRAGIPGFITIGAKKSNDNQSIRAHAWVEIDGEVINDLPSVVEEFNVLAGVSEKYL